MRVRLDGSNTSDQLVINGGQATGKTWLAFTNVGNSNLGVATTGQGSIGFKNRRQLAAWLGLVPRQCFSVGKNTLGSISKRDDVYIRTLLFHGAKTVSNARKGRQVQESWLGRPVSRRNKNVATVALNNKNARVLWVLLTNDKEISPEEVMGAAYM
ncbi:TPA: transposase [Escherichia coli]|nr:transposase [Escherichia coli]